MLLLKRVSVRRKKLNALFFEPETRFEGEYAKDGGLLVDRAAFDESDLREDCPCEEEEVEAVLADSRRRRAYEKGLWLLDARDYTERGMTDKLRPDFGADAAAAAVARYVAYGLIDDGRYAARLAEQLLTVQRLSRRQAREKLIYKGVPRDLAEEALDAVEADPAEQLDAWIQGKFAVRLASGEEGARRKVVDALLRRGFAYEDVKVALARWEEATGRQEEETYDAL